MTQRIFPLFTLLFLAVTASACGTVTTSSSWNRVENPEKTARILRKTGTLGVPEIAWHRHREIGVLDIPGWREATATLIAKNIVITGEAALPQEAPSYGVLPADSKFVVYAGTRHNKIEIGAIQYQVVTHRRAGKVVMIRLVKDATQIVPKLRPAKLARQSPRSGDILTRYGFGGWTCSATTGGRAKLRLRHRIDGTYNFSPLESRCPQSIGAPTLDRTGAIVAISNYSWQKEVDRYATVRSLRKKIRRSTLAWRKPTRRSRTAVASLRATLR